MVDTPEAHDKGSSSHLEPFFLLPTDRTIGQLKHRMKGRKAKAVGEAAHRKNDLSVGWTQAADAGKTLHVSPTLTTDQERLARQRRGITPSTQQKQEARRQTPDARRQTQLKTGDSKMPINPKIIQVDTRALHRQKNRNAQDLPITGQTDHQQCQRHKIQNCQTSRPDSTLGMAGHATPGRQASRPGIPAINSMSPKRRGRYTG